MSVEPTDVTVTTVEVELQYEDLFASITRRVEGGSVWWDLTFVGERVLASFAADAYRDAVDMGCRYLAAAADGVEAVASAMSEAQAAKDAVIPQTVDPLLRPPVILKGGVLQQPVSEVVLPAGPVVVQ